MDGSHNRQASDSRALNILIPAAGLGSRFSSQGYRLPKPLVGVLGEAMITILLRNLKVSREDAIYLAISEAAQNQFSIEESLSYQFPDMNIKVITLPYVTSGAAETLLAMSQKIPEEFSHQPAVAMDCDTIYTADVLSMVRALPYGHGACFYCNIEEPTPIFSFIEADKNDLITRIVEKRAISNKANTGIYVFPSVQALRSEAHRLIGIPAKTVSTCRSEAYASMLVEYMIEREVCQFKAIKLQDEDFFCVGTPRQLQESLRRFSERSQSSRLCKKRIAFELEGALFVVKRSHDYDRYRPILRNIEIAREWTSLGHEVVVYARPGPKHRNKVNLRRVKQLLSRYGIMAVTILFTDLSFDFIVSDKAVHAHLDTRRELGLPESCPPHNPLAEVECAKQALLVPSRDFNTLKIDGDIITKTSQNTAILGEIFFYAYLPKSMNELFPVVHDMRLTGDGTFLIKMKRVNSVPCSFLLTSKSLTENRLSHVLDCLHKVHCSYRGHVSSTGLHDSLKSVIGMQSCGKVDMYANYHDKLQARYVSHQETYHKLGLERTRGIASTLIHHLKAYQAREGGLWADIIHGDPVFSNVMFSVNNSAVTFLDMRGQLGQILTTGGDQTYDLAKVLQSLYGYDYIILVPEEALEHQSIDSLIPAGDQVVLAQLRARFWTWIGETYGSRVQKTDVALITASLLFSLIPLHRTARHELFLTLTEIVLAEASTLELAH